MPDEVSIFAKLGSWLYGSLMHATGVLSRTFESDMAAIRIFEIKNQAYASYVDSLTLGVSPAEDRLFQSWPEEDGSLMSHLGHLGRREGVFRTADLPGAGNTMDTSLFQGLGRAAGVADCICLSFGVSETIWGVTALIRFRPGDTFTPHQLRLLEQVKPALAHMIRSSCQRQGLIPGSGQGLAIGPAGHLPRLSADEILARLTRTECQVLQYLRMAATERQISEEIHRSQHTIHVHVKNIYRKLGVSSRRQLMELFSDYAAPNSTLPPRES